MTEVSIIDVKSHGACDSTSMSKKNAAFDLMVKSLEESAKVRRTHLSMDTFTK
jgi:hypothetical protein